MSKPAQSDAAQPHKQRSWQSTAMLALAGCGLLWASFPPVGWTWMAWLAPLPWLCLIAQPADLGRRQRLAIWIAGLLFWLVMLQGIRLAHWLNHFGWLALSAYLAVYLPLFVGLSRWAVRKAGISIVVVTPVVWTGLELARGYLFTGFSMALLGHSQFENPHWIQIADLGGAYAVSFLLMLAAACLIHCCPVAAGHHWKRWPAIVLACVLGASWAYGARQLARPEDSEPAGQLKVALIQGLFNTYFEADEQRFRDTFVRYIQLSQQASEAHPDLDLIVWPESVFSGDVPEILGAEDADLPSEAAAAIAARIDEFAARTRGVAESVNQTHLTDEPQQRRTHLLLGTQTIRFQGQERDFYNTALLIDPAGKVVDRYYKMHPVMFGEYIPFGDSLPWIYSVVPLVGLTPGQAPAALRVGPTVLSPSICFESAVPHLIRRQFTALSRSGAKPNVIVNLTHDGWFWGSTILDFQLAGAVFRAVELRTPTLVAANAGISAWIDDDGRIRARGPRQGEAAIVASVEYRNRPSLYAEIGDWFAGACLFLTVLLSVMAFRQKRSK